MVNNAPSRRLSRFLVVAASVVATLVVPVATASAAPGDPAGDVVRLTNEERARAGCAPLGVDARLAEAAQEHSADMAAGRYLDHTARDGQTFDRRISAAGYPDPAAENIAYGYPTADAVVAGWMSSPDHRANILKCSITRIGVGFDAHGQYWTQDFGY